MSTLTTQLIPATERDSKRLMVVLHGLGDSMEGYRWLPDELGFPWLNYLLVNAPDDYPPGYSWYDIEGDPGIGIKRSYKLLSQLLDSLRAQGYPTKETLLFGFSQGCLMTVETGLRYPHLFAGLIGISGYMHEPATLVQDSSPVARQQKMLITHGHQDPLIPFGKVKAQFDALREHGFNVDWRAFVKAHTIAGRAEIEVIRNFTLGCFEGVK